MPARFALYGHWLSGPTYKVGLMLSLAGQAFDYHHVDLRAGAHKVPEYLAKQRYGQVPMLSDSDKKLEICQSAVILDYLADATGQFGGNAVERIRAREWMAWEFDRLGPPIYRLRGIKAGLRQASQDVIDMYAAEAKAALDVLNAQLAKQDWLAGTACTIADVDVYGVLAYAADAGLSLSDYPHIQVWMKRIEALPGFIVKGEGLPKETKAA